MAEGFGYCFVYTLTTREERPLAAAAAMGERSSWSRIPPKLGAPAGRRKIYLVLRDRIAHIRPTVSFDYEMAEIPVAN